MILCYPLLHLILTEADASFMQFRNAIMRIGGIAKKLERGMQLPYVIMRISQIEENLEVGI